MPELTPKPERVERETPLKPRPTVESAPERREVTAETGPEVQPETAGTPAVPQKAVRDQVQVAQDEELRAIENILAEGMEGFFMTLNPEKRLEFKTVGEATAVKIRDLIHRGTYRIKDIIKLIINWLKSLPGINKFFLEQEAKIKADKIIRYYHRT